MIGFSDKCRLDSCFILIYYITINRSRCSRQRFFLSKSGCSAFCHTDAVGSALLHQAFCIISNPCYYNLVVAFCNLWQHITHCIVRNLCYLLESSRCLVKFCIINLCIFCHLLKHTIAVQFYASANLLLCFLPCQHQFSIYHFHIRIRIRTAIIINSFRLRPDAILAYGIFQHRTVERTAVLIVCLKDHNLLSANLCLHRKCRWQNRLLK